MSPIHIDHHLDTRGLFCPEPVMMLHNLIADVQVGQVIKILATDPSTQRDFTKFCTFLGHEMISIEEVDDEFRFVIKRLS